MTNMIFFVYTKPNSTKYNGTFWWLQFYLWYAIRIVFYLLEDYNGTGKGKPLPVLEGR